MVPKRKKQVTTEINGSVVPVAASILDDKSSNFFKLSIDLLCIAGTDGFFKEINQSWTAALGWTIDELKARPFIDFVHPDDRSRTLEAAARLAQGIDVVDFENRYLCKVGGYKKLSWTVSFSTKDQLLYAVARDITQAKETEASLKKSESDLSRLLHFAPVGIYRTDSEGNCVYINSRWENITGLNFERAKGKGWLEAIHPSDRPIVATEWENTVKEKRAFSLCYRYLRSDGSIAHVQGRSAVEKDEQGNITGFLGSLEDVTESTIAKEKIERGSKNLAQVQAIAHLGNWDWDLNSDCHTWSEEVYRMLNIDKASASASLELFLSKVFSPDREAARIFLEKGISSNSSSDMVLRIVNNSDAEIRYIHITKTPRKGADSREGFGLILSDITALKEVENQNTFYKSAVDQANIVAVTDEKGVITYVNDLFCTISGYTRAELIGKTHKVVNSGMMEKGYFKTMWQSILAGKTWRGEICNRAKDGSLYWVDTVIFPMIGPNGKPASFFAIRKDVTKSKNAELELKKSFDLVNEAAKVKSLFLANMSHEIRTPMNGVIGMTTLLLQCELSNEAREYAETIRRSGEVLLSLVNDILDLSKLEAHKIIIEEEPFNLRQTIDNVVDLFAEVAEQKGLLLTSVVDPKVPRLLKGDSLRIQQILSNLVSNALKFTPIGRISILTTSKKREDGKEELSVCVSDTGIGIKQETVTQLFERFAQGDLSTTKKFGGTGLGLAISKGLAELMDGKLSIQSEIGQGTAFTLNLPLQSLKQAYEARPSLKSAQICLCTRNTFLSKSVCEMLGFREMNVDTVDYIEELAGKENEGKYYDLLLIDLEEVDPQTIFNIQSIINVRQKEGTEIICLMPRIPSSVKIPEEWLRVRKPVKQSQILQLISESLGFEKKDGSLVNAVPHDAAIVLKTPKGSQPLILVAEDNSVNQRVIMRMLEKMGCRCDVVANGAEALESVQRVSYDLLLMDCFMPEMDGYEATRRIRSLAGAVKEIPIIAVTANALRGDDKNCVEAGMDAYVAKPIRVDALVKVLKRWLKVDENCRGQQIADSNCRASVDSEPPTLNEALVCELSGISGLEGRGLFLELIEIFAANSTEAVLAIQNTVNAGDPELILRSAHKLKGMSENIGAVKLGKLCASLELMGKTGEVTNAQALYIDISKEHEEVRKKISDELASAANSARPLERALP